ncbi:hypothetical protein EUX98_g5508 [Antrodiella citrinella]|uniref:DUF4336 domain-containing protein n=1 Tax=Antrodiella citrinella TaxID=2447956 RepID=A0A4S4MRK5_9APHY|nr:hypothetical protein EUX98_g5508 [Antrodiella citrinella]
MTSQATNENTVIREVAKDVWTFSSPFKRFDIVPFGGRSTAIKLTNGDVWVLASTPLNDVTKDKLTELGPVRWIIGADAVHYMFLSEFKKEYPEAKVIAVDASKANIKDGLTFDGAWGADSADTKYGFETDIQHCYFSGFRNKDVAFFHPESKSLIQADLLLNLPPTEQASSIYSKTGSSGRVPILNSIVTPTSWLQKRMSWALGDDKAAMKRDVKTTLGWDFTRIIPCHGDVIEKEAKEAWRTAFQFYLD